MFVSLFHHFFCELKKIALLFVPQKKQIWFLCSRIFASVEKKTKEQKKKKKNIFFFHWESFCLPPTDFLFFAFFMSNLRELIFNLEIKNQLRKKLTVKKIQFHAPTYHPGPEPVTLQKQKYI